MKNVEGARTLAQSYSFIRLVHSLLYGNLPLVFLPRQSAMIRNISFCYSERIPHIPLLFISAHAWTYKLCRTRHTACTLSEWKNLALFLSNTLIWPFFEHILSTIKTLYTDCNNVQFPFQLPSLFSGISSSFPSMCLCFYFAYSCSSLTQLGVVDEAWFQWSHPLTNRGSTFNYVLCRSFARTLKYFSYYKPLSCNLFFCCSGIVPRVGLGWMLL